jgi:hypothetical protein
LPKNKYFKGVICLESENTAIVLAGKGLFKDINFADLNNSINALADISNNLTIEDRKAAIGIIDQWERDVLNRLGEHSRDLDCFVRYFSRYTNRSFFGHDHDICTIGNRIVTEEKLLSIAAQTGTLELYNAWVESVEAFNLIYNEIIDEPLSDPDLSQVQVAKLQHEYNLKITEHKINGQRATNKVIRAFNAFIDELNKNDKFRSMRKNIKASIENSRLLTNECRQKSQMAKVNVMISSSALRESLKEMQNFLINI